MTPGPGRLHMGEENYYFLYGNRNKKSVTLNLQKEKGRDILLQLAKNADIFVENFRPQVKYRLRINYSTLTIRGGRNEKVYDWSNGTFWEGLLSERGWLNNIKMEYL